MYINGQATSGFHRFLDRQIVGLGHIQEHLVFKVQVLEHIQEWVLDPFQALPQG